MERGEPSSGQCDFCQKKIGPSETSKSRNGWMSCHRSRCQQLMEWQPPKPGWKAPKERAERVEPPLVQPPPGPPLARDSDPVTSHQAGEAMQHGNQGAHCTRLLELVAAEEGEITAVYVARAATEGIDAAWKRISDLVNAKQLHYRGTALNPETNRQNGRVWLGPGPTP